MGASSIEHRELAIR